MNQNEDTFVFVHAHEETGVVPNLSAIGASGRDGFIPDVFEAETDSGKERTVGFGHEGNLGLVQGFNVIHLDLLGSGIAPIKKAPEGA
jgi:hypothetical protein